MDWIERIVGISYLKTSLIIDDSLELEIRENYQDVGVDFVMYDTLKGYLEQMSGPAVKQAASRVSELMRRIRY